MEHSEKREDYYGLLVSGCKLPLSTDHNSDISITPADHMEWFWSFATSAGTSLTVRHQRNTRTYR